MAEVGVESAVPESSANGKVEVPTEVQDVAVTESQPFKGNGTETERVLEEASEPEGETNANDVKEDAVKGAEDNGNDEDTSAGDGGEEKIKADEKSEGKVPKKRGRGRVSTDAKKSKAVEDERESKQGQEETPKESKKRKIRELSTPTLDRPSRERKTIERFVASNEKENVKEFTIEKGRGTLLKDIPNVVYKLSKRSRADENVRLLHAVLYGKRGKAFHLKNNILQFSGYVWGDNEEKLKGKVKEKLEKYNKENLLNLCDLLDIHVAKTSNKKEEIVVKLIEFLEAPHVTTDVLLEEKVQTLKAKKRKRKSKGTPGKSRGRTPGKSPGKKQKKSAVSKEERRNEEEEEGEEDDMEGENENDNDSSGGEEEEEEDKVEEEVAEEEEEEDDDEDYGQKKKGQKRSSKKRSNTKKSNDNAGKKKSELKGIETSPRKALRSPKGSTAKDLSGDNVDSSPHSSPSSKVFSRKNKKEKSEVDKTPVADDKKQSKKRANASVAKSNTKEKEGKNKAKGKSTKSDPSDDDIRSAISDILQRVDFNTATFTDILKQLVGKFDIDFSEKKAYLKNMIHEELSKLAEGDDEEDHSMAAEENIEKDESEEQAGQVVEAQ